MTSKKPASSKRTAIPKASDYAKAFRKDWERLARSGRYDLTRLKEVMLRLIANGGPLGSEGSTTPSRGTGWVIGNATSAGTSFSSINWTKPASSD